MSIDFTQLFSRVTGVETKAGDSEPAEHKQALGRGIPEVARPHGWLALPLMLGGAVLLTTGFVYLVSSRHGDAVPALAAVPVPPPAPPLPGLEAAAAKSELPEEMLSAPVAPRNDPPPAATDLRQQRKDEADMQAEAARARRAERLRSPLLVADATPDVPSRGSADGARLPEVRDLSGSDAESAYRMASGSASVDGARARLLANQHSLIAQGTLIAGVLETAVNSDLSGMLRAVVAGDISSFDGSTVLIPKGSRLIGRYRSGIAVGQTRAFVVWTRLITPDGVSIGLESPGTDELGRAGVTGEVDEHFFKRFGAALLFSILGSAGEAAANAAGDGDDLTINAASGTSRVAEAVLQNRINIPPTIKVRQGAAIRIFVARDLDFSGMASRLVAGRLNAAVPADDAIGRSVARSIEP